MREIWLVRDSWPVGVGTVSEAMSREDRYAALCSLVSMGDPVTDLEETTNE